MPIDCARELELLVRARTRLIVVESFEESRVRALVKNVADGLQLPFHRWTITGGLVGPRGSAVYDTKSAQSALATVASIRNDGVFLMDDLADALSEPVVVRALKDLIDAPNPPMRSIIISAPTVTLPESLRKLAARMPLALPSDQELTMLIGRVVQEMAQGFHVSVTLNDAQIRELVSRLRGLTASEAERAVSRAVVDDLALTAGRH